MGGMTGGPALERVYALRLCHHLLGFNLEIQTMIRRVFDAPFVMAPVEGTLDL